jgi:hypothetical protein
MKEFRPCAAYVYVDYVSHSYVCLVVGHNREGHFMVLHRRGSPITRREHKEYRIPKRYVGCLSFVVAESELSVPFSGYPRQ